MAPSVLLILLTLPPAHAAWALSSGGATPLQLVKYANETVMVIAPHPDDLESAAGGTVSMLTALGARVVSVVVTDGSKGCTAGSHGAKPCDNITPPEIAAMRAAETRTAAKSLGIDKVIMLTGYSDGFLYDAPLVRVRQELTVHMRAEKPALVMSFLPYPDFSVPPDDTWGDLGFHTDHMDTGRHVLEVARGEVGNSFTFEGSGPPLRPNPDLLFWSWGTGAGGSWAATHYLELPPEALKAKLDAWACHRSQYGEEADLRSRWTLITEQTALRLGLPSSTRVEAFVAFGALPSGPRVEV